MYSVAVPPNSMSAQYAWLLLFLIGSAYGSSNTSEETHHAGWMSEPKGRGTLGIVFPCLFTIGLCVWSAIHIDIIPQPTAFRVALCQFKWLIIAVGSPDTFMGLVQDQFWTARAIKKCVESTREKKEGWCIDPSNKRCIHKPACRTEFPMAVAYFIVMGGLVIDPGDIDALPLTLTPHGFAYHYMQGLISDKDIDLAEIIADKSKAGGLGKFLVCSQTLVSVSLISHDSNPGFQPY